MLLTQVGILFIVIPPNDDEDFPTNGNFKQVVVNNAERKAKSVVAQAGDRLILGSDTIVDLDNEPLGKPIDTTDAKRMLHLLSGRTHRVHSGIVLYDPTIEKSYCDHAVTDVTFRSLTDDEIDCYIETGEPMDKAGSYGIQARGALFIKKIDGCFFNVMGLPLAKLWELLMEIEHNGVQ